MVLKAVIPLEVVTRLWRPERRTEVVLFDITTSLMPSSLHTIHNLQFMFLLKGPVVVNRVSAY